MRWQTGRRSENIEDRRGLRIPGGLAGGGIGVVIVTLIALFLGVDPRVILQDVGEGEAPRVQEGPRDPAQDRMKDFMSVVLADTEDTWDAIFRRAGATYERPKLVLFSGAAQSACGFARAAVGPFYCARDRRIYIDLSFFDVLVRRFGAAGDFAQAYVLAHEVGHHVQNLLGVLEDVATADQRPGRNTLLVRQELQADCYAGIWANHANRSRQILEQGDIEEGLNAAAAIGDDRLQMQAQGYVAPESFTHGSSEQRVRWFRRGLEAGDISACDTFNSGRL
jgi:predicted metalloprotease